MFLLSDGRQMAFHLVYRARAALRYQENWMHSVAAAIEATVLLIVIISLFRKCSAFARVRASQQLVARRRRSVAADAALPDCRRSDRRNRVAAAT